MPQMAPISWLSLFIGFFIIFLLFMVMNYFLFTSNNMKSVQMELMDHNYFNWKW